MNDKPEDAGPEPAAAALPGPVPNQLKELEDFYNSKTPKEQRQLDNLVQLSRARTIACPNGLKHLFPGIGSRAKVKTKS